MYRTLLRRLTLMLAAAAALLTVGSAGGAIAGSLITGHQIKNGTITSKDVANKSLRAKDLSESALTSLEGPAGASGLTTLTVRSATIPNDPQSTTAVAFCASDERAISGGATYAYVPPAVPAIGAIGPVNPSGFVFTGPVPLGGGWTATLENAGSGGSVEGWVYAMCAKP